jgi:excisionase family DNA binding protein
MIQGWLGLRPMPEFVEFPGGRVSYPYTMPDQPPEVLLGLVLGLYQILGGAALRKLGCRSVHPEASSREWTYVKYITVVSLLLDWPHTFHAFLDIYSNLSAEQRYARGLAKKFKRLYRYWLERAWVGESYQFVQDAFNYFVMNHVKPSSAIIRCKRFADHPELLSQFKYITVKESARALGVTDKTIEKLVKGGHLTGYGFEKDARKGPKYLVRAEVMALQARWQNGMSLADTAAYLGLSEDVTADLVKIGMLRAERGPDVDQSAQWFFLPTDVDDCLDRILEGVRYWNCESQNAIDLATAARKMNVMGFNAAAILRHISEGKVPGYRRFKEFNLANLTFKGNDIDACVAAGRLEHGWVKREYIASKMGADLKFVSLWVAQGLIEPIAKFGTAEYFDKETVDRFVCENRYTRGAAEALAVSELTIHAWVRKGRLNPVTGPEITGTHRYLFNEAELEKFRPENCCTAPEMAERLGISHSQLLQWITVGKVKPISGPGIDDCGRYLFSLTDGEAEVAGVG